MLGMTITMFALTATGFCAGLEFDRCRRRVNENRRRRREEAIREAEEREYNRIKKQKERSDKYVAYTFYNAPGGY